jgi:hypothetical protein
VHGMTLRLALQCKCAWSFTASAHQNTHPPFQPSPARTHRPPIPPSPQHIIRAMWDDEDNNPYGSFARHDANANDGAGLPPPGARKPCETHARMNWTGVVTLSQYRIAPRRRPRKHRPPHRTRQSTFLGAT